MQADARRALEVLKNDGIIIIPADVGYAIATCNEDKLEKIFKTKARGAHKRHAILGNYDIVHKDLHIMDPDKAEILRTLVEVYGVPLGTIAKFKRDHSNLSKLSEFTMRASTVGDTIDVLVNAGPFINLLTGMAWKEGLAIFGSSANLTGTGMKYKVEDIEQPVQDIADIIIDYGLAKYWIYGRASTMIDFTTMRVVRFGACYPTIQYVLRKYFEVDLPNDPGLDELRDGHMEIPDAVEHPPTVDKKVKELAEKAP